MSTRGMYSSPARGELTELTVMGAGSWGTALAVHAARAGHRVVLWGRDPEKNRALERDRDNRLYLPGAEFPDNLRVESDAARALRDARIVISAIPSRHLRGMWKELAGKLRQGAHMVSATKGIEGHSGCRMTEVLAAECPGIASVASISGPSFARELVDGHPTAVALGSEDQEAAHFVQEALSAGPLRVYRNDDTIGVEMGGALKNVIAIAAGIVDGLGFGYNTQAALISRGLKEITDLAVACGARQETLMGLAGLGDLVLTCTGPLSRNRGVGVALAGGQGLAEIVEAMDMVAEGVVTTRSARETAMKHGVEMPIAEGVHAVLYEDLDPRTGIDRLLARALVEEWQS